MNAFKRMLTYAGGCFLIVGGIVTVTWGCLFLTISIFNSTGSAFTATIVGIALFSLCFGLVALIDDEERGDM